MLINQLIEVIVNHNTCIKGTSKTHLNTQGEVTLYQVLVNSYNNQTVDNYNEQVKIIVALCIQVSLWSTFNTGVDSSIYNRFASHCS
jgi:hypothetical protein